MRDRLASIKLQLDVLDRSHDETAELAAKVFELLQTRRQQWLTADYAAKASNPRNRVFELLEGIDVSTPLRNTVAVVAKRLFNPSVEACVRRCR